MDCDEALGAAGMLAGRSEDHCRALFWVVLTVQTYLLGGRNDFLGGARLFCGLYMLFRGSFRALLLMILGSFLGDIGLF